MSGLREFAKFACGWEAFHAFLHAFFWFTSITFTVFGITLTPTLNVTGVFVNAVISVLLDIYGWELLGCRSRGWVHTRSVPRAG